MNGIVHSINPKLSRVAIETASYGFTIVELAESAYVEVGDEFEWHPDSATGRQDFINRTRESVVSVDVLNHWVTPSQLRSQLGLE